MTAIASRPFSDSTDSLLRFALRADATLTGLTGLAIAAAAGPLSSLSGLTAAQEFAVGAAFVLYGLVVFGLAALPKLRGAGMGVAIANVAYTVGSVLVVLAGVPVMTHTGAVLTLASGVYTAFFALLQYLGVRRLA
jgi:hypothetical protein